MSRALALDLPTSSAVAELARGYLEDGAKALKRLSDRKDTEALHDFRVAMRRLRCLLRAYRPWIGRAGGKRVRRGLRDLADATHAGRDSEVQLEWLASVRESLSRGERTGLNWLARQLRKTRREAYSNARRDTRKDFRKLHQLLEKRLADSPDEDPPLSPTIAALLREHADEMEAKLAEVRSADDVAALHESRIAAKRLRYLLQPLTELPPPAVDALLAVLRTLAGLQQTLGKLRDVHVLEAALERALVGLSREKTERLHDLAVAGDQVLLRRERRRDERIGLAALITRARTRRNELFAELQQNWSGEPTEALLRDVRALADAIRAGGPRIAAA